MSYSYDGGQAQGPGPGRLTVLAIGVLSGALLIGLVWLAVDWPTSKAPDATATRVSETQGQDPALATQGVTSPVDDRLSRCQEVYTAQEQPMKAAESSMSQWEVHIGAMNKLVVGAITLAQATQFWSQTREGARTLLHDFAAADRHYEQRSARCPHTVPSTATGGELGTCTKAVAARNRVVHTARRALATWRMHVMHMEMLRNGEMTPEQATSLWLKSWREGQGEVDDYRAAVRDARGLQC
jgi:hypothetical protein